MEPEPDFISNPEAFARANEKAWIDYLRSLTPERAAQELEDLLNMLPEFLEANEMAGGPSPLPNPLPGPTLAILLEGKPSDED